MGVAPGQYLLRLRLEKAERLMTVYHERRPPPRPPGLWGHLPVFRDLQAVLRPGAREYCKRQRELTRPWRGGAKCGILPVTGTERKNR